MRLASWIACGFSMIASACGSDVTEAPLACEAGPELTATHDTCEFTVEGLGGPTAVHRWSIEDDTLWDRFALAPDGSLYLFTPDQLGFEGLVARFGPDFEFAWSRRLTFANEAENDDESRLRRFAFGDEAIHVAEELQSWKPPVTRSWLLTVGHDGTCSDPFPLALGGNLDVSIDSLLREDDGFVLSGTTDELRGFIQRIDLSGAVLDEAEILNPYYDQIEYANTLGRAHEDYVVSYGGYSPVGYWSNYTASVHFDSAFQESSAGGGPYVVDALSHIHRMQKLPTMTDPYEEAPPPETIELTRLAVGGEPDGETRILTIPQPQCGTPLITLYDEERSIVRCSESPGTILGYEHSGSPSWTLEGDCASTWTSSHAFGPDGRLWWLARTEDHTILTVAEFD